MYFTKNKNIKNKSYNSWCGYIRHLEQFVMCSQFSEKCLASGGETQLPIKNTTSMQDVHIRFAQKGRKFLSNFKNTHIALKWHVLMGSHSFFWCTVSRDPESCRKRFKLFHLYWMKHASPWQFSHLPMAASFELVRTDCQLEKEGINLYQLQRINHHKTMDNWQTSCNKKQQDREKIKCQHQLLTGWIMNHF